LFDIIAHRNHLICTVREKKLATTLNVHPEKKTTNVVIYHQPRLQTLCHFQNGHSKLCSSTQSRMKLIIFEITFTRIVTFGHAPLEQHGSNTP